MAQGVLSFRVGIPDSYTDERALLFYQTLEQRLRALPGARSVRVHPRAAARHAGRLQQLHARRRYQRHCRTRRRCGMEYGQSGLLRDARHSRSRRTCIRAHRHCDGTASRAGESVIRPAPLPRSERHRQAAERRRLGPQGTVDDDHRRRRRRAVHGRGLGWNASDLLRACQPEPMAAIGARHRQDRRRSCAARRTSTT